MHQINENQTNLSPFHDEFEVGLKFLIHNLMVDSIREYHKFVGLEFDDEKFVGFVGTVRGDFDHGPYQEWKCPNCDSMKGIEYPFGDGKSGSAKCKNCNHEALIPEFTFVCNDLCPVCHPKKYSIVRSVKGCGNCNHFDPTGETETAFCDGETPESMFNSGVITDQFTDGTSCHGNINADMQPCEFWVISVIKCRACGAEHIGLPDWCGVCGENIAVEV